MAGWKSISNNTNVVHYDILDERNLLFNSTYNNYKLYDNAFICSLNKQLSFDVLHKIYEKVSEAN